MTDDAIRFIEKVRECHRECQVRRSRNEKIAEARRQKALTYNGATEKIGEI